MGSQDNYLEDEHNEFIKDELFCQIIKEKVENSHYYKYSGIAPDGFILIPTEVLESLKDFENWKEFKNDENWIENQSKIYCKKY